MKVRERRGEMVQEERRGGKARVKVQVGGLVVNGVLGERIAMGRKIIQRMRTLRPKGA
jgi:hypothetical protein